MHMSVHMSMHNSCTFVYTVHMSGARYMRISVRMSMHMSIHMSIHVCKDMSIHTYALPCKVDAESGLTTFDGLGSHTCLCTCFHTHARKHVHPHADTNVYAHARSLARRTLRTTTPHPMRSNLRLRYRCAHALCTCLSCSLYTCLYARSA